MSRLLVAATLALGLAALLALASCAGQVGTSAAGSAAGQMSRGAASAQDAQDAQGAQGSQGAAASGKVDIRQATIVAPASCRTTGYAVQPKVKVVYDGKVLARGTDYELSYENNKKPGMARIVVQGKGDYEGTAARSFQLAGVYNPLVLVLDKSRSSASGMMNFLRRCGCRPVFTSSTDVDMSRYDGLAIPGGGDVDPAFYGEENVKSFRVYTWLDEAQMKMIRQFAESGKPVLGICRGAQIINVAFGGSLYQHIENGHDGTFPTAVKEGSWLYGLFGDEFLSFHGHHQAIRELGQGLSATQWSRKDEFRVVEMVEHVTYPVWGVQYHPEVMGKSGDAIGVRFRTECLRRM